MKNLIITDMPNNNDVTDLYSTLLANIRDKKDSQRLLSSYSAEVIKAVFRKSFVEANTELFEYLLKQAAFCHSPDVTLQTLLLASATNRNTVMLQYMLEKRYGDPNLCDKEGRSILHLAVHMQNIEMVKVLCSDQRVNINISDIQGQTPLYLAAKIGYHAIIDILLATKKADSYHCCQAGYNPFTIASYQSDIRVLQQIFHHKGLEFQLQTLPGDCRILCANLTGTKAYIHSIWQELIHEHDLAQTVFLANSDTVLVLKLGKLFKGPLNQALHAAIKSISAALQRLEERVEPLLSLSRSVSFSQESPMRSGSTNRSKPK